MSELDYSLLDAIKSMAGEYQVEDKSKDYSINYNINENSEDIEILDFMVVFLCERLRPIKKAFKGGYVLMKLLPEQARYSHDIDFSISSEEQYDNVKLVLDDLGKVLVANKVISNYTIKDEIAPTKSGGIICNRDNLKSNIGIDIGLHDISYGIGEWKILGFTENVFLIERMLADKLSAIYSPKRFRRAKDLYDVYILKQSTPNINYKVLLEFINKRGITWEKTPFQEKAIVEYKRAYDKLKIENISTHVIVDKPSFEECIYTLQKIVIEVRSI